MALDPIPQSTQSDGRWKIAYVPIASDPLSLADIESVGKNMTYSFTPDGFNLARTQATVNDPRLTLVQVLSRPGKVTETLALKYVDSQDDDSAARVLTDGLEGYFVIRRGVDNDDAWAVGDEVDVIQFVLGVERPDAPTENGVDTISRDAFITAVTQRRAELVAGE